HFLGKFPGGVGDMQRPPRSTAHLRSETQLLRVPVLAVGARELRYLRVCRTCHTSCSFHPVSVQCWRNGHSRDRISAAGAAGELSFPPRTKRSKSEGPGGRAGPRTVTAPGLCGVETSERLGQW